MRGVTESKGKRERGGGIGLPYLRFTGQMCGSTVLLPVMR